jgi:flavin-dependent dehydrogenase
MGDESYDVVSVGGGMGGLNLAALLAHEGQRVLVLEKNGRDLDEMIRGSLPEFVEIDVDTARNWSHEELESTENASVEQFVGERTRAAKVMGVYGAPQAALEACRLITSR